MNRMKKLIWYFIFFILLFFFVEFMSNAFIISTYNEIEKYNILMDNPKIEITKAITNKNNGEIYGTITNNMNSSLENKYLKIDYYSQSDNYLGSKYIEIKNLNQNEEMEFLIKHKFSEVTKFKIDLTDEIPEIVYNETIFEKIPKWAWIISGFIVLTNLPIGYLFGIFPF